MAMMRGHLKLRKRKPVCHASEMCRGEKTVRQWSAIRGN